MGFHRAGLIAMLSALTLGSAVVRSDDTSKAPPPQPPAGFLEFLGSVDGLSEMNPNYLSQPNPTKVPAARGGTRPPVTAPPAPAPSGDKNNG